MMKMLVVLALAVVLACLPFRADAQSPCPEEMFAIYLQDGTLVSCEEFVGVPEACPEDAVGGYLEDGTLAGCYSGPSSIEETCSPTGEDADGDGWDDGCDPCPGLSDCDFDGFSDGLEGYVGTDPTDACPETSTPNDEDPDAWPVDMDDDQDVDIVDVLQFKPVILSSVGDPTYNRRFDLNADGNINISDILLYKDLMLTTCDGPVPLLGGAVVEPLGVGFYFHLNSQTVHGHAEFRWTIPWPFPIPDWVDVKYSMDFGVEMIWVDYFNISAPRSVYCFVNDEPPYYLEEPWISRFEPVYPGPARWKLECSTFVWLWPELGWVGYPAKVWIDWQIPGYFGGGASGFHKWWIYEH